MGIAFRNPYPHAVSVAVEGNFGYYPTPKPYQMYLFTRTSDGQIKILKSSLEPGAIYLIEGKKRMVHQIRGIISGWEWTAAFHAEQ